MQWVVCLRTVKFRPGWIGFTERRHSQIDKRPSECRPTEAARLDKTLLLNFRGLSCDRHFMGLGSHRESPRQSAIRSVPERTDEPVKKPRLACPVSGISHWREESEKARERLWTR